MDFLTLYFVMGSQDCSRVKPEETLKLAIEGGVTCFQFREKGLGSLTSKQEIWRLGARLQRICEDRQIPFFVNDDVELGMALEADGIHVGQEDTGARVVRELIGPSKILGVSTHTITEAHQAIIDGADYLGLGPIFPTISKQDIVKQQSVDIFKEFRNAGIDRPLVAIGGISLKNADMVMKAGADGVAIISDICRAEDIRGHVQRLRKIINHKT